MDVRSSLILVCGLGRLGEACLRTLRHFDPPLRCLDLRVPEWMAGDGLEGLRAALVIGDMRNPDALRQAGAHQARSVLLLCSDSGMNLEAALQVRLLNPGARMVVRSNGSRGLDRHLRERLPGLALVDPELLTAGVFTNALRPDGSEAAFSIGRDLFRVRRSVVEIDGREDLFSLQERQRRLLQWFPAGASPPGLPASQWWDLNAVPGKGDQLLWLEAITSLETRRHAEGEWLEETATRGRLFLEGLQEGITGGLRHMDRWRWAGWALLALVLVVGSARFGFGSPLRGLLLTLALLKGEYIDALSAMTQGPVLAPEQMDTAALGLAFALGGTLFTAWLVAVILDWLLARRLGRREPKPLPSRTGFVLLVGGHRLAQRLERLLVRSRFRVVRVQEDGQEDSELAFRSLDRALRVLRHCRCQGVAVLGDDLMANLETALGLQERWPQALLAVQSHSPSHGSQLSRLFPGMAVVNPLELAAEAVVATAFGERVREVLRVADTNLLLTDYRVEEHDTLAGRSLAEMAEGYGVLPVSLVQAGQAGALLLPGLDRVLQPGDSLLVLATLQGLRAVERGRPREPLWCLEIRGLGVGADVFAAQMVLARFLNQSPGAAGAYLDGARGPRQTPRLHQAPGRELEASLRRLGIQCALIPARCEGTNLGCVG